MWAYTFDFLCLISISHKLQVTNRKNINCNSNNYVHKNFASFVSRIKIVKNKKQSINTYVSVGWLIAVIVPG